MAKLVAWLVLIFVVLLALRIINARKARTSAPAGPRAETPAQPMVRCERCGVFLPRADASPVMGGYACTDSDCAKR